MIIPSTAMTGDRVVNTALGGLGKISPVRSSTAGVAGARGGVVVAGLVAHVGRLLVGAALAGGSHVRAARLGMGVNLGVGADFMDPLFGSLTSVNFAEALLLGDGRNRLGKSIFLLVSKGGLSVGVLHGEGALRGLGDTGWLGVVYGRTTVIVVEAATDGFAWIVTVEVSLADVRLISDGLRLDVAEAGVGKGMGAGFGGLVKLVSLVVALDVALVLRRQALLAGGGRVRVGVGTRKMVAVCGSHLVFVLSRSRG